MKQYFKRRIDRYLPDWKNDSNRTNVRQLFGENINIKSICTQISTIFNTPIVAGETLLFIDEIQESKRGCLKSVLARR